MTFEIDHYGVITISVSLNISVWVYFFIFQCLKNCLFLALFYYFLIFSFQIIPIDDLGQFKGKVILCDLLNSAMCVFFIFILSVQLTEERQYKKHLVNVCGKPGLVVM